MKSELLLPNRFKTIGWIILIPATIAGIILISTDYEVEWLTMQVFAIFNDEFMSEGQNFSFFMANVTSTMVGILFIAGALMVGFSMEKREDEFISNLRLTSLLWSVWVNYALLLLAFLFVWGMSFLNIMVYNMFTILIIFIIRFNYILYRSSKPAPDEK